MNPETVVVIIRAAGENLRILEINMLDEVIKAVVDTTGRVS